MAGSATIDFTVSPAWARARMMPAMRGLYWLGLKPPIAWSMGGGLRCGGGSGDCGSGMGARVARGCAGVEQKENLSAPLARKGRSPQRPLLELVMAGLVPAIQIRRAR